MRSYQLSAVSYQLVLAGGLLLAASAAVAAPDTDDPGEGKPQPGSIEKPNGDGLGMRVRPVADGIARTSRWTVLRTQVVNVGGDAGEGDLAVAEPFKDDGSRLEFHRTIELPKGAKKSVSVPFRPGLGQPVRDLVLTTQTGMDDAEFKLDVLGNGDVGVGVVGEDALGVNVVKDAWGGPVPGRGPRAAASGRRVRTGLLPLDAMPDREIGYDALDWVVWPRPEPEKVEARQVDALRHWVADGGHLLVTVTDDWQAVNGSALGEMLPVALDGVADVGDVTPLVDRVGGGTGAGSTPMAHGQLRTVPGRDVWVWAAQPDGAPLWVTGTYGLGTVTVLTVDPTLQPLAHGVDRETLWRRLLWLPPATADATWYTGGQPVDALYTTTDWSSSAPQLSALDSWTDTDWTHPPVPVRLADALHLATSTYAASVAPDDGTYSTAQSFQDDLRAKLGQIPGVTPLPLPWLLGFSAVYLFVIGPFDWFVLRLLKRQPLTWITFPAYIAVFSAVALVGTSWHKGNQSSAVRIELVDGLPGTDLWRGDTFLGLFSTQKAEVQVTGGFDDAVVTPMDEPGAMWEPKLIADEGPGRLTWRAETWTLAYVHSRWTATGQGGVTVERTANGWKVASTLPFDLDATEIDYGYTTEHLGPVAAGATVEFPAGQYPTDTTGTYDFDIRTATPEGQLSYARQQLAERPALGRGHDDAKWAHPALLAVAHAPIEPNHIDGLGTQVREMTVLRLPLDPAALVTIAPAVSASVSASTYVPGGTQVRIAAIGKDDYDAARHQSFVGKTCTVDYDLYPSTPPYYSGSLTCDGAPNEYFASVVVTPASAPTPAAPTTPTPPAPDGGLAPIPDPNAPTAVPTPPAPTPTHDTGGAR